MDTNITKDTMYGAVAPDDFESMIELDRYENRSTKTAYLEAAVSEIARGSAFYAFAAHLALDAERFHAAYNGALRAHRERSRTRSPAQPFPDLAESAEQLRCRDPDKRRDGGHVDADLCRDRRV